MSPGTLRAMRRKSVPPRARAPRKKKKQPSSSSSSFNVNSVLDEARALEATGRFAEAIERYESVVKRKTNDVELIEELALAYMQASRPDDAEAAFRETLKLQPNSGFEKYGYLAQLLGNTEESLEMARRGIEIIKKERIALQPSQTERHAELRQFQISALCAVAEISLGIIEDSNDPGVAMRMDVVVENAIMEALGLCEEGSQSETEVMLSLANLRLSQGKKDDARRSMLRILQRINPGLGKLESADGRDEVIVSALETLPPMEMRIAIGKQLLEVELWHEAISVLASVMWDCDFNVEVWYMLAVAYWKLGEVSEAKNALENTRAVLKNPEGFEGDLEEEMIDKLYSELDKVRDASQQIHMHG